MRRVLPRLARNSLRYPLALALAAAAVGAGIARAAWASEAELAGVHFSFLSWILLIVAVGVAERSVSSRWAFSVGASATAAGVAAAWSLLSAAAAFGEPMSQEALRYQAWTPSVTSAALLMAVSSRLRPATRWTLRWVVGTGVVVLLLMSGHASDVARMFAVLAAAVEATIGRPARPGTDWRPSVQTRWRSAVASALVVIASGLALGSVVPNATGVLAWAGAVIDPIAAPVASALLVVSAVLIMRGRILGIVVGGIALAGVAAVSLVELIVRPIVEGGIVWQGLTGAETEWQVILLLSGGLPALAALILALGARKVIRRPAPVATAADRQQLHVALKASGDSTFAHMATWAGNSLWFGEDGSAVAYRVRDGIAFTVGDPISEDPRFALRTFAEFCESRGWTPVFYSIHDEAASALQEVGWARIPVGTDAVIDVDGFTLSGRRRQDLRTAVNRADREGLSAVWTRYAETAPAVRAQVDALCTAWVEDKRLPEMGFTLGGLAELTDPDVRLMLAIGADGRVQVVTSWLPLRRDGRIVGWTLDVMRRDRRAMPGAMEFTIVSAVRQASGDGLQTIGLSGTPLAPHEGRQSGWLARRMSRLLEPSYGFASLERFKAKFGARHEPLWMSYPQPLQLPRIGPALLRTYAPTLRLTQVFRALRAAA
ncbi:bifunctional lysylphosphatidylglycerol flippase/synthetase MprF [Microbacterium azadirachtae]|uniref:bifunctional lysylphosphatidylglycerol flippase/synthetase MprF n=1 Tax=Microbacterium azadirachtae TaxID=582680 RepID=UPI0008803099|nr:DUF2156 domain-containing protein [Microbacterium azadirachtae]SDL69319.1 Lysylphosphatidylglycerol synthetase, C-terminal domain, DUF2156 family [Microbacterium azadirachtae]SEF98763.1 Lysylphosphatidylglycerol synthetase, C-terminal domain, DUF2156 family [Microbacterium azadirachtae]SEG00993.1 Lysylphosphatidylglycerol synthetase, C-terminal domain, DUF2156 family [Microbacterium azadirachtae]